MKHTNRLLILTLFLLLFTFPASAHKGNTDGNGGHWDSYNKKYHYHHGHGAHQHEDINGDGILDCPLDKNWSKTHIQKVKTGDTRDKNEISTFQKWIGYLLCGVVYCFLMFVLPDIYRKKR